MRALKKAEVVNPENLERVERWLDSGGSVAKAFKESLEVGQVLNADVLLVLGASNALLCGGLKPRTIALLVQDLLPKPHGRPALTVVQVLDVLEALTRIGDHLLAAEAKASKR